MRGRVTDEEYCGAADGDGDDGSFLVWLNVIEVAAQGALWPVEVYDGCLGHILCKEMMVRGWQFGGGWSSRV